MALSARNQLKGKVTEIQLGSIMAHVAVQVGENEIESVITRRSAEQLNLQVGDTVLVVIKSTEVMIQK
jgi:molybdopterin-binding protein